MPEATHVVSANLRTIATEQVRMLGLRFRVAGLALLVLGLGISSQFVRLLVNSNVQYAAALHGRPRNVSTEIHFSPALSGVVAIIALIWPLAIWQDEPPSQRAYHLVMPVRAWEHTLIRVLAGWCWLMLITASIVALIPASVGAVNVLSPSATRLVLRSAAWWEWLVPFTAATVAYLATSGAAVGTRRPIVWLGGVVIGYVGAITLLEMLHYPCAAEALAALSDGEYGAAAALAGHIEGEGGISSLQRWIASALLWGAAAATLLVAVANRRTEQ